MYGFRVELEAVRGNRTDGADAERGKNRVRFVRENSGVATYKSKSGTVDEAVFLL